MTDSKNTPAAAPAANPQGRRKGLTIVAAAVAVAAVAWGGWHWMVARNYQTTDNAYVAGNVVQITPQVGGTVISIGADDTDYVKPGQVLVQLESIAITVVWSGVVAFIGYKLADMTVGLRVPEEQEREGLDVNSHGENAYNA